jgi:hypothetical protein
MAGWGRVQRDGRVVFELTGREASAMTPLDEDLNVSGDRAIIR